MLFASSCMSMLTFPVVGGYVGRIALHLHSLPIYWCLSGFCILLINSYMFIVAHFCLLPIPLLLFTAESLPQLQMCWYGSRNFFTNGCFKGHFGKCYICSSRWSQLATAGIFYIEEKVWRYLFCNSVSNLLEDPFFSYYLFTLSNTFCLVLRGFHFHESRLILSCYLFT